MSRLELDLTNYSTKLDLNVPGDLNKIWSLTYTNANIQDSIFASEDTEGLLFWDHSVQVFVRDRPRPNEIIGEWGSQRKMKISFLERFYNISGTIISVSHFIDIFQDPVWDTLFDFMNNNRISNSILD